MLPEWLDNQTLQWVIPAALVVLAVVALTVLRFIRRLVLKTVLVAVIAGFGISLWVQRADLQDCAQTCECSLYGRVVKVDPASLPQQVGDRLDASVCETLATSG